MNRKGFTLIELLAVIIVIALIATIVTPSVIEYVNSAKNTSYNLLIQNTISASKTYYEECEYGDLSDSSKYKSYACQINGSTITTTLGALANTGMLSVNNVDPNDKNKKIVINPKDNTDISSCNITITKTVDTNYKVTYNITSTNCSYINGSIN
ncbi:MAG: type II secretion system protein [Bacilli bacterium]|nr:type II secretion system protein [Bacilli bacterium]